MRLLVTNDDGVEAPGILHLARALVDAGYEIVVAGPRHDLSGSGAAVGSLDGDGVAYRELSLPGLDGVPVFAVDAPPARSVLLARLGAFGEQFLAPDLVVAGVNPGLNTGPALLHSGTVGAALTAGNWGLSGMAVSIDYRGRPLHFESAAAVAAATVPWLAAAPAGTVLNVNVPNRPLADVAGVRWARPASVRDVPSAIVDATDGRLMVRWPDGDGHVHSPGTDNALVDEGFVAVTGIVGPREAPESDAPAAMEQALGDQGALVQWSR